MTFINNRWLSLVVFGFAFYGVLSGYWRIEKYLEKNIVVNFKTIDELKIVASESFDANISKLDGSGFSCAFTDSKGYEIGMVFWDGKVSVTLIPPRKDTNIVSYIFETHSGAPDYRIVKDRITFQAKKQVHSGLVWRDKE